MASSTPPSTPAGTQADPADTGAMAWWRSLSGQGRRAFAGAFLGYALDSYDFWVLVVSMRPVPAPLVATAVQVSASVPAVHGAPVQVGDPAGLGIADLASPDFGAAVEVRDGEVPVFWACGVTPQVAIMASRPPFAITHAPGHMFVTDIPDLDLRGGEWWT